MRKILQAFLFIGALAALISCQKDQAANDPGAREAEAQTSYTIEQIAGFYDQATRQLSPAEADDHDHGECVLPSAIIPDWEKAEKLESDGIIIVNVPIGPQDGYLGLASVDGGDSGFSFADASQRVIITIASGSMYLQILSLIPSKEYVDATGGLCDSFVYGGSSADFDGIALLNAFNGGLVSYAVYYSGKLVTDEGSRDGMIGDLLENMGLHSCESDAMTRCSAYWPNPCGICGMVNCHIGHRYCIICAQFDCGKSCSPCYVCGMWTCHYDHGVFDWSPCPSCHSPLCTRKGRCDLK